MTRRDDDLLRDALLDIERAAPAAGPPPLPVRTDRRVLWGLSLATAAAAILVGVLFSGAMRDRSIGDASPTPEANETAAPEPSATAEPTARPTPTAVPTPTPSPEPRVVGDVAWSTTEFSGDGRIEEAIFDAPLGLWIALGQEDIWVSRDASAWESAELPDTGCPLPEGGECRLFLRDVVRAADRLVTVGWLNASGSDSAWLVAWRSTDGRAWELIGPPTNATAQNQSLAYGNGVFVVTSAGFVSPDPSESVVHISTDGTEWPTVATIGGLLLDVHGDNDGFVAVGYRIVGFEEAPEGEPRDALTEPVIQISDDGRTWTELMIGEGGNGSLDSITRDATGRYVASGVTEDGRVVAWTSLDRTSWSSVSLTGSEISTAPDVTRVAAVEDGFLLVSTARDGMVAFTSSDGTEWRSTAAPQPASAQDRLTALATSGAQVTAFGVGLGQDEAGNVVEVQPYTVWHGEVVFE